MCSPSIKQIIAAGDAIAAAAEPEIPAIRLILVQPSELITTGTYAGRKLYATRAKFPGDRTVDDYDIHHLLDAAIPGSNAAMAKGIGYGFDDDGTAAYFRTKRPITQANLDAWLYYRPTEAERSAPGYE